MTAFDAFVEKFHETATGSNYSRKESLRGTTHGDLTAAAAVLWDLGVRQLTEDLMEKALLAQVAYYKDDDHLASERRQEFMDFADVMGLTASTMERVVHDVARSIIRKLPQDGCRAVENESGIYIFKISEEDVK